MQIFSLPYDSQMSSSQIHCYRDMTDRLKIMKKLLCFIHKLILICPQLIPVIFHFDHGLSAPESQRYLKEILIFRASLIESAVILGYHPLKFMNFRNFKIKCFPFLLPLSADQSAESCQVVIIHLFPFIILLFQFLFFTKKTLYGKNGSHNTHADTGDNVQTSFHIDPDKSSHCYHQKWRNDHLCQRTF